MKFKTRAKDIQLLVRVKTSFGEAIDEKELDRFSRVYLRGFLKPKLVKRNVVEYTGPVGISLYERLQKTITKRDFLFIIEQIVVAVQKIQGNNLGIHNLVMQLQQVYINEVTKEVQFIYLPTKKGIENLSLIEFIEAVTYSAKPVDARDAEFISSFMYFFKAMQPFDIFKVEAFVAKEDRSIINIIKKQNAGQSGFMTNKQQDYYAHYREKNAYTMTDGDEATELLRENDEATGLLCEEDDEATGLLTESCEEVTGLLCEDEDATGLLIENSPQVHYPSLHRILTDENISVNKPVFRLGKEKSYVDYFVTNNIAVSRSHADIITRGDRFYVKDLNSKNHTYINEQELPVHMEIEIRNGDRLKLGNEEFIFYS